MVKEERKWEYEEVEWMVGWKEGKEEPMGLCSCYMNELTTIAL